MIYFNSFKDPSCPFLLVYLSIGPGIPARTASSMIVCNHCGTSMDGVDGPCTGCSGKGIAITSPLQTGSSESRNSDRWANNYTDSPNSKENRGSSSPGTCMNTRNAVVPPSASFDVLCPDNGQIKLTRVHGCLLDPKIVLPQCSNCNSSIPAGKKLFVPPSRSGSTFCRLCYSTLFSLGVCHLCKAAVLGDKEEGFGGRHVKGLNAKIWHARCFACVHCAINLFDIDHVVLEDQPQCRSCATVFVPPVAPTENRARRYIRPGEMRVQRDLSEPPTTIRTHVSATMRPEQATLRSPVQQRSSFQTVMAIQAKAGLVRQMQQVFERGGTQR
ncbi:hypothetical protein BD324DRAFT_615469 [Kockovaella imperatae]|uniref:LIM zinc-binding domain-containing protein n=1 Tax=Kockovaella imperatae TaxID=4999 RepID=A0A1Y1UR45_9TREE|nr:hypothetical protein BD324DRAFT_615469 [Kockovaella imperatae]ORX39906.1 hypothetical protein BD324DRAFT_615469 [Kockovaella imperatae]